MCLPIGAVLSTANVPDCRPQREPYDGEDNQPKGVKIGVVALYLADISAYASSAALAVRCRAVGSSAITKRI
eukprot:3231121-Pyramimonas_sp.AAC.1